MVNYEEQLSPQKCQQALSAAEGKAPGGTVTQVGGQEVTCHVAHTNVCVGNYSPRPT